MHLFEVTADQSGEVKCVAKHETEHTVCHTNLVVFPEIYQHINEMGINDDFASLDNEPDNVCPAYILCGPEDCTALIGGQVVLEVIYGGHPDPVVKWLKAVSYCNVTVMRSVLWAVGEVADGNAFPTRDQWLLAPITVHPYAFV